MRPSAAGLHGPRRHLCSASKFLQPQRQIVSDGHAVAFLPQILGLHRAQDLAAYASRNGQLARTILTAVRKESAAPPAVEACRSIRKMQASRLDHAQ
jgi:hypothetical protein